MNAIILLSMLSSYDISQGLTPTLSAFHWKVNLPLGEEKNENEPKYLSDLESKSWAINAYVIENKYNNYLLTTLDIFFKIFLEGQVIHLYLVPAF